MDEAEFERRLDEIRLLCRGMTEEQLQTVVECACDFPVVDDDDDDDA